MLYELGRAVLTKKQISKLSDIFDGKILKEPWNIIKRLIELLKDEEIIFILDQFKEKTVNFKYFDIIKKILLKSKLKIIICSSINDSYIKKEVLDTIKLYHGNPHQFDKESQKYYYYFSNLLDIQQLKLLCEKEKKNNYELFPEFNYNPKYTYLLSTSKNCQETLEGIKIEIKSKLHDSYKEKNVSSDEVLFFISLHIGNELDYYKDFDILEYISMKYFVLEMKEKFFKINYCFDYIKTFIKEVTLDKNIEDFYKYDKSNQSTFYKKLSPYYFEESCINALKDKKFLPSEYNYSLNVESIVNLDENEQTLNSLNYNGNPRTINKKEYYEMNIKTIKDIFEKYQISKENEEDDIFYHLHQGLKLKDKEFNASLTLLNKKKYYSSKEEEQLNKKINIYNYKDSFYNGGILINQTSSTGKSLDFGFLYGKQHAKIFVGFQIKKYSENVKLSDEKAKNLNKNKIKDNLSKLLIKTLLQYNMMIEEWHFFLISYYDPILGTYNRDIVNLCIREGLEYFFYDPKSHNFYDRNFDKFKNQTKLKLTFNSNLDYNKYNSPDLIFENFHNIDLNIYKYCKISIFKNELQSHATEFVKVIKNPLELKRINNELKNKFPNFKNLNLIAIYHYSTETPFPIPNNQYLLLFINKEKDDYVYYFKENNTFHCGFVIKKNILNTFFLSGYIDTDSNNLKFIVYKIN